MVRIYSFVVSGVLIVPNPNYKHTITIYNCLKAVDSATGKDIWYKTVINNCFYKVIGSLQISGTTLISAPSYVVRIPQSEKYLPYKEWISNTDKANHFTISETDLIIHGAPSESITGVAPLTATNLVTLYKPDAFRIKLFSDNSSYFAPHYKVGG